jgi:hypothetical protein
VARNVPENARTVVWDDGCVLIDPCGARVFRARKGTKLWQIGDGDRILDVLAEGAQSLELNRTADAAQDAPLITFAEAARRSGLSAKTLYNWKAAGKLGAEQGLVTVASRPRVAWSKFRDAFAPMKNYDLGR